MAYTEATLRKKALAIGFQIEKGFQHDEEGKTVKRDGIGRITGYQVKNLADGSYVHGSKHEGGADHLWSLEDVESFLRDEYNNRGIRFFHTEQLSGEDVQVTYSESTLRKKARNIGCSIKKDTINDGSSCYTVYCLIDEENHIEMLHQVSLG